MAGPRPSHLFMRVFDLERTRLFYVDMLGLNVLAEYPGYLRIGEAGFHIGIEEGVSEEIGAAGIELNIEVNDVDGVYDRLQAQGVDVVAEPADMPWGARHAWLRDPDGYILSIYTSASTED